MDRRTACLALADAFREQAMKDPEHRDHLIDEAIRWLERAMEVNTRAAVTVEPRQDAAIRMSGRDAYDSGY